MLGQNLGHTGPQVQAQVLHENGSFHSVLGLIPLILGRLLCLLKDDADTALVLYLLETLGALVLLLGQFAEKCPTCPESHPPWWKWQPREK